MWAKLVSQLEESRIYHRPENPFIEFKWQDQNRSFRSHVYIPFQFDLVADYAPSGFSTYFSKHPRFMPKVPLHVEFSSDKSFLVSVRCQLPEGQIKFVPKPFHDNTVQATLLVRELQSVTSVLSVEHADKFGASLSFNPFGFGLTYIGPRSGVEFVYNVREEQPAISGLFHVTRNRTEAAMLVSLYGNVMVMTMTDFKYARVSSMIEANMFTFMSTASVGLSIPVGNSFMSVAFELPKRKLTLEAAINSAEENGTKAGITAYIPVIFRKNPKS